MTDMTDGAFPAPAAAVDLVQPAPRRVRVFLGGRPIADTTSAVYVWERPEYPRYYLPRADVERAVLVDEGESRQLSRGTARVHGLRVGDIHRPGSALVFGGDAIAGVRDTVRVEWDAVDAWLEEDEEIFVHPRNPYVRVDALRSGRRVTIGVEGVVVADSSSTVMVFETGLPTRYYFDRTCVNFSVLEPSPTVTACPYKGRTTRWWGVRIGGGLHPDLAWCYDFPTRQLSPIAGLVAFYNERADVTVDGILLPRPKG